MLAWTVQPPPAVPAIRSAQPDPLRVRAFDTASQQHRPVGPEQGTATLYVCGITPYDATHLGHANTYVAFDLLHRTWLDAGLSVRYVQNVTDIDDPLLERAGQTGEDWRELAERETQLFREDMAALNVLPPHLYVGAVESIPLVLDLIGDLDERAAVYPVVDAADDTASSTGFTDQYFATATDPAFGSLSRLDEASAIATFAERGGDPGRSGKRHPLDCLLWRGERPGEPAWPAPYGPGRPGWHIECTAIALHHLGAGFDVQGGGSDLVFPHHEMCAAEARAVGSEFAQAYLHSGMVGLDGTKMSKSLGNLVLVSRLREAGVDPMAIRLVLLAHHYRSDWSYSSDDLAAANERLDLWRQAVSLDTALSADQLVADVRAAMAADLDAPAALATIDAWAAASLAIDSDDPEAPAVVARLADALLGVSLA